MRFDEVLQKLKEELKHVDESLRRLAGVAAYLRTLRPGVGAHVDDGSAANLDTANVLNARGPGQSSFSCTKLYMGF
jgi:hypothetical protein